MSVETVRQEIIDLENKRIAALKAGDVETLSALVSDDLVHIHGRGHVDDKAGYLAGVANKFKFHRIERGPLQIRVYGDVVVVNGPLSQTVSVTGVDKQNDVSAIVTQTWIREQGHWRQNTCHMHFVDK